MEKHQLPGTIRLYGTPAEETLIGKVYMSLAGEFDDLDACLHWHPAIATTTWNGESKAAVSAKFTFTGVTAHASGSPEKGRSALDAVELMNIGANYMREHLKDDARVHYVVTDGGGAPNVVPAKATVWYYVRANDHADVERNFAWLRDIADGAAKMTRTTVSVQIDTDCHEIIPNDPLAALLSDEPGADRPADVHRRRANVCPALASAGHRAVRHGLQDGARRSDVIARRRLGGGSGSTDVGDISWHVPTGGLRTDLLRLRRPGP